ncbi:hypothetical protein [Planctobacterium marinum]|uniref:hypothetical protein n=1 Tax=Planctobacterium marinum TaxID=1631968 RepID=UPI001E420567|nr:hypothetical protein [Planctobacterium marinum]MCC2605249.1 hypothetical protein [Planctobacterium marinum]
MEKQTKKLLTQHEALIHSEDRKVISHVQREDGDWILHTLMLESVDVPFKYRRKKRYKNLQGARVNLTYYPDTEEVAGIEFEYMRVVRLRTS